MYIVLASCLETTHSLTKCTARIRRMMLETNSD